MVYRGFSVLPSSPRDSIPATATRGGVLFSKFELCLLIPFTVLDAVLGISSVIYIVKHSGIFKPLAVSILCSSVFLLVLIILLAVYRLRRVERCDDLESSMKQNQQISASRTTRSQGTEYVSNFKEGTFTEESRPTPTYNSTLAFKVYFAVRRAFSPSLPPRRMFETVSDKERLLFHGEAKTRFDDDSDNDSSVSFSDARRRSGLWTSIFELAGDARLPNLKRLSKESRRSRYELCPESDLTPNIVITKPEPTASPPGSRRGSKDFGHSGETPLPFDPLRSHPSHIRESTLHQSKSLQDLKFLSANPKGRSKSRRSRSAGPSPPEQFQLGHDQRKNDRRGTLEPKMLPVIVLTSATPTYETKAPQLPRGLRKHPSPRKADRNLRTAYNGGI